MKTVLHVGCGPQKKSNINGFNNDNWIEIRFDIDEKVNPDIVGTLIDMSEVETNSVDAIYSSHNIEHLFSHEVPVALKEMYRVLNDDGYLIITCPDLVSVCNEVTSLVDTNQLPINSDFSNTSIVRHTPFDITLRAIRRRRGDGYRW